MVRIVNQLGHQPVPQFPVSPTELTAVLSGRLVPRSLVNHCLLSEPSLEDYACSLQEHAKAKETEELPEVLQYIEKQGLSDFGRKPGDLLDAPR